MYLASLLLALACHATPDRPPVKGPVETPPDKVPDATAPADPATPCDAGALARGGTAVELNTQGYRCYKAGEFEDAASLFTASANKDDTYALAHYNLACTLARLRAAGKVCDFDATESVILDHLERAVALDAGRAARMKDDPDLATVRSTVRYQVLAGADLSKEADLRAVLEKATFYGPAAGVYGNTTRLDLKPGATAILSRMNVDDDGNVAWSDSEGRWTVREGRLSLEMGEESWQYTLEPDGSLTTAEGAAWWNFPSECEA